MQENECHAEDEGPGIRKLKPRSGKVAAGVDYRER